LHGINFYKNIAHFRLSLLNVTIINEGGISISIKKEEQIDIMIDEGLGGGQINDSTDKDKLKSPLSKRKKKRENEMIENFSDAISLGNEMEQLDNKKELKEKGLTPDPE
jgi:hypothetical protein